MGYGELLQAELALLQGALNWVLDKPILAILIVAVAVALIIWGRKSLLMGIYFDAILIAATFFICPPLTLAIAGIFCSFTTVRKGFFWRLIGAILSPVLIFFIAAIPYGTLALSIYFATAEFLQRTKARLDAQHEKGIMNVEEIARRARLREALGDY